MDYGGSSESYQLSGTAGSILCPQIFCVPEGELLNPPPTGQCYSNCFCQQDGRHTFTGPVGPGSGDLEMVYGTGNLYSCRASPRQGEHRSRLGVTTPARLQRLEIETPDFSGSRESAWTILHRPFCIKDQCSTRVILQLEARPICCSGGCCDDSVDEALPLPVPPVGIDLQMPRQDQKGTDVGSPHSSPLAESGVVPTSPRISSGPPNPAATNPRHSDESKWKEPPSDPPRPSSSSRVAHLKQTFRSKGLLEGVIEILKRSWRTSTQSAYSSTWGQWDSWCTQRSIDPLSAPISSILEFLFSQYNMGKQYRTINTIRSAISMTHEEVDGTRVGQHPLVTRFLKGVFNSRPPAPKYVATGMWTRSFCTSRTYQVTKDCHSHCFLTNWQC